MRSSTRLRVIAVTHTGEMGGAESALLRLIRSMDRSRFDVECVTMEQGALVQRMRGAGVRVHMIAGGDLTRVTRARAARSVGGLARNVAKAVQVARKLRRVLAREQPDLVVANSLKAAVLVALAAPMARVPWVWHLHDRLAPGYLPGGVAAGLRLIALLGPRRVVVNSRATAATLGRRVARKVVVAYPGLEPGAFVDPRPVGQTDRAVGIVGRVSKTKGQREFLAAAAAVGANHADVHFRVIGAALFEDADEERDLRAAVEDSPIASRVQWTGWVDDVIGQLRRLSVLVHASPVPEPFGQVVTEAMAAGVPVIAAGAGGVLEILDPVRAAATVADGVRRSATGVLVRPGDSAALSRAIDWILDHPHDCAELARQARVDAHRRFRIETTRDVVAEVWARAAVPPRWRGVGAVSP